MPIAIGDLLDAAKIPYEQGVLMANHTTLRVGGPVACYVSAGNVRDIIGAVAAAREAHVPVYVLGNGSNLLVRDAGIEGVVINLSAGMADVTIDGTQMRVQAGARLSQVALAAQDAGLSGMEAISGIPGTIGGALYMNAGSYGVEMASLVRDVEILDMDSGGVLRVPVEEMGYGYRQSAFMHNNWVALLATLQLARGERDAIAAEMRRLAMERRAKQPLSLPSAGSFFKRPSQGFAGAWIEQAGLKGVAVGGAQVSEMHAGFLVNTGGATAQDFLDLMALVQARVLDNSGVTLEPEVQII